MFGSHKIRLLTHRIRFNARPWQPTIESHDVDEGVLEDELRHQHDPAEPSKFDPDTLCDDHVQAGEQAGPVHTTSRLGT